MTELTKAICLSRATLTALREEEMFVLLSRFFDGVTRAQFRKDLDEKTRVILLERASRLVGFSTLLAYESFFAGEPVSVVYSGDTIVAPEAWNTPALSRAWIECVRELRKSYPRGKCYWLLLTSGFRTYRFLPLFWHEFYPRFDTPTPPEQERLLNFLARERFASQYLPERGIVRFAQSQRLRDGLNQIPMGKTADPHVSFFLQRNPGHVLGDELVCLTELADENLTAAGRRMVNLREDELHCCHC